MEQFRGFPAKMQFTPLPNLFFSSLLPQISDIIVDYLQLMQGEDRRENRVQEIGYISRSLKALARDLNVPVLALSQLSRQVDWRASHIPKLSDLRESGSIEQDADIVIFIHREEADYTIEEWQDQHPDREYPR
ncbi:unnamed protein product, partial [marine sediment metagenome]